MKRRKDILGGAVPKVPRKSEKKRCCLAFFQPHRENFSIETGFPAPVSKQFKSTSTVF